MRLWEYFTSLYLGVLNLVSSSFFLVSERFQSEFHVLCCDNLQLQTIIVCVRFNVLVKSWIFLITGHTILYNWIMIIAIRWKCPKRQRAVKRHWL